MFRNYRSRFVTSRPLTTASSQRDSSWSTRDKRPRVTFMLDELDGRDARYHGWRSCKNFILNAPLSDSLYRYSGSTRFVGPRCRLLNKHVMIMCVRLLLREFTARRINTRVLKRINPSRTDSKNDLSRRKKTRTLKQRKEQKRTTFDAMS